jgi:hypothetical protein
MLNTQALKRKILITKTVNNLRQIRIYMIADGQLTTQVLAQSSLCYYHNFLYTVSCQVDATTLFT